MANEKFMRYNDVLYTVIWYLKHLQCCTVFFLFNIIKLSTIFSICTNYANNAYAGFYQDRFTIFGLLSRTNTNQSCFVVFQIRNGLYCILLHVTHHRTAHNILNTYIIQRFIIMKINFINLCVNQILYRIANTISISGTEPNHQLYIYTRALPQPKCDTLRPAVREKNTKLLNIIKAYFVYTLGSRWWWRISIEYSRARLLIHPENNAIKTLRGMGESRSINRLRRNWYFAKIMHGNLLFVQYLGGAEKIYLLQNLGFL